MSFNKSKISIDFIVVNRNTKYCIILLLNSLKEFIPSWLTKYRIIVWDNDSKDGSLEYLQSRDDILLVRHSPPFNHDAALDCLIENYVKHNLFVTLDSDVEFLGEWIEEYVEAILKESRNIAVGPWHKQHKSWIKDAQQEGRIHPCCAMYKTALYKIGNFKHKSLHLPRRGVGYIRTLGKICYHDVGSFQYLEFARANLLTVDAAKLNCFRNIRHFSMATYNELSYAAVKKRCLERYNSEEQYVF